MYSLELQKIYFPLVFNMQKKKKRLLIKLSPCSYYRVTDSLSQVSQITTAPTLHFSPAPNMAMVIATKLGFWAL